MKAFLTRQFSAFQWRLSLSDSGNFSEVVRWCQASVQAVLHCLEIIRISC